MKGKLSPHPDPLPSHQNGSGEGTAGGPLLYSKALSAPAGSGVQGAKPSGKSLPDYFVLVVVIDFFEDEDEDDGVGKGGRRLLVIHNESQRGGYSVLRRQFRGARVGPDLFRILATGDERGDYGIFEAPRHCPFGHGYA